MHNSEDPATDQREPIDEPDTPPNSQINSTDDLSKQLKEKNKEIKVLQTKNSKLQTKYVELFKEQKTLKKNIAILTDFAKIVLPHYDLNRLDIEELKQQWGNREDARARQLNQQRQDEAKEKKAFEEKIMEEMELKIQSIQMANKAHNEGTSKEIESFKKNNKILMEQIGELDKKLDSKSDQVSKLTKEKLKLEHQINQIKMESITQELSDGRKSADEKSALDRNEFLALRQQVDSLMEKRDALRKQLKQARNHSDAVQKQLTAKQNQNKNLLAELLQEQKKVAQINSKLEEPRVLQKKESISSVSSAEEDRFKEKQRTHEQAHHLSEDDEYVHREYMKNVFIRYMDCWGSGDSAQAEVLLSIILTLLKLNGQERQKLATKRKNWWKVY